jgi:hypothetical protein
MVAWQFTARVARRENDRPEGYGMRLCLRLINTQIAKRRNRPNHTVPYGTGPTR